MKRKYSIGIVSPFEIEEKSMPIPDDKYYELLRKNGLIDGLERNIKNFNEISNLESNAKEMQLNENHVIRISEKTSLKLNIDKSMILILIIDAPLDLEILDRSDEMFFLKIINNSNAKIVHRSNVHGKRYKSIMGISEGNIDMKSLISVGGILDFNISLIQKEGKSRLSSRSVLSDNSMGIMRGNIKIPYNSKADGKLAIDMLALGENVRAIPIPSLEISSKDVRCAHSATVSSIDKDQLYYIMSRGISKDDSMRMIVDSFLGVENGH